MLDKLCWDLDEIFIETDLLHISGILPALSKKWQSWTVEIVRKAKEYGCYVSFDMNYRSKLWSYEEAYPCYQQILPYVDILSAGRLDAIHFLKVVSEDEDISLEEIYKRVQAKYPNIKVLYSTKRNVFSTNHNELQGFFVGEDGVFVESKLYDINPIIDRVGGGDAFAAGILNGVLKGWDSQQIVDFGTATTFDCVDGDMNYRGGIICPGMNISAEALYTRAAKLPRVEIEAVSTSLGMDTTTQMQAGLFYGFLGQFENIIKHLKEELDGEYKVVLTGGLSKFIGKHSEYVDVVDEELTLKGIIELYKMNKEK